MSVKKTQHVVLIMYLLVMCGLCGHVYGSAFSVFTHRKIDLAGQKPMRYLGLQCQPVVHCLGLAYRHTLFDAHLVVSP